MPNGFGIYRFYPTKPDVVPDIAQLSLDPKDPTGATQLGGHQPRKLKPRLEDALGPFPNFSCFLQACWDWEWLSEGTLISDAAHKRLMD